MDTSSAMDRVRRYFHLYLGGGGGHMLKVPTWGGIFSDGRPCKVSNPMICIVAGYNGVITASRKQKGVTIRERVLVIPRLHYK